MSIRKQKKLIPMTVAEIEKVISTVHGETAKDKEDGTRMHVHYKSFGKPTVSAKNDAKRADELGLPRDRYTGRVVRVWKSARRGDMVMLMMVELERDHVYRAFNFNKGIIYKLVVLGN